LAQPSVPLGEAEGILEAVVERWVELVRRAVHALAGGVASKQAAAAAAALRAVRARGADADGERAMAARRVAPLHRACVSLQMCLVAVTTAGVALAGKSQRTRRRFPHTLALTPTTTTTATHCSACST
jgi:hypothetical protein